MTISALIERLSKVDPDAQIMILDGFNGGGVPREINLGPMDHVVTAKDVDETCDCEGLGEGTRVFVLGFGNH